MGKRILVVDDNPTNRKILMLQMQSWGVEPTLVASGPEALVMVQQAEPFDMAVLDMQMPDMDGLMLAEELRQLDKGRRLPLVMLTSLGWQYTDERIRDFSAFLTKPVKPSHLYEALINVLAIASRQQIEPDAAPVAENSQQANPAPLYSAPAVYSAQPSTGLTECKMNWQNNCRCAS